MNDRIALKDGYCLFLLRLIAKVVTKRKQVEQNITQTKSRERVSWTVERRLRIFQGIVYFAFSYSKIYNTIIFSRCYYRLFTFCVFTCTQNTAKQLKIKEIKPHKESPGQPTLKSDNVNETTYVQQMSEFIRNFTPVRLCKLVYHPILL